MRIFEFEIEVTTVIEHLIQAKPGTSGLEKTAPSGELEYFSRSKQKNIIDLLLFFQSYLDKNSSSPEGAVFSRADLPGSGKTM